MIPIERTHEYRGRYHVLGGALSPIDGVDPDDLRIAELYRARAGARLARSARSCSRPTRRRPARRPRCTSPTGCASARRRSSVTRLASGLPVGSDLEYADEVTLGRAFAGRRAASAVGRCMTALACAGPATMRRSPTRAILGADEHRRDEVRRHLGRRRRADQARRAADRRQARGGPPRRRRALGARQDDRRADRDGGGGLAGARPARDGHAALDRRADLVRAVRDGDQRPRPRGAVADRLAGRDRHRHLAHQGADPRRPRRPHHGGARRGARSCSSPASRASRPATT